jgi:S1-C subfamily serine protease
MIIPKTMLAAVTALLICHAAAAQSDRADVHGEDLEALRSELAEARTQLAEAARRMAEIQRRLGADSASAALDSAGRADVQRIRFETEAVVEKLTDMPPRLGVLLEPGSDGEARVVGLTPGGGAERAGIRPGDVIVSVNGRSIDGPAGPAIRKALEGVEAGDTVEVVVARNDGAEERALGVETSSVQRDVRFFVHRLGDAPGIERHIRALREAGAGVPVPPPPPRFSVLGPDTDLVANHAGLESYFGTGAGVIVLRIDADNPMRLRDGDVILTLDRAAVDSPVDLARMLMQREAGERVALEVMRNGVLTEVGGAIPERAGPFGRVHRFRLRAPDAPAAPPPAPAY